MNSQILKIKYLQCTRGHYHQGEQLNTVCLNLECKQNALCCCACIDQLHKGHQTTTLKKFLLDAGRAIEKAAGKERVKPTNNKSELFNTDIILNLIEGSKKQTLQAFHKLKGDIDEILGNIQTNIQKYYAKIQQKIINPAQEKHPSEQALQSIETIQTSSNFNVTSKALHQLLISLEYIQVKNHNINLMSHQQQLCQDSMLNLIQHSNQKVHHSSIKTLQNVLQSLTQSHESIERSLDNINHIFNHEIFYFSSQLKSPTIWLNSSYEIVCKQDKQYQVALMQPNITSQVTVFKYRIKPNASKWIAFGVCYKKMMQKKGYTFEYKYPGHGCYMISSNGGVWSHTRQDLNNMVKAFSFKQGDTITCVVNQPQKQIFFIKENGSKSYSKSKEMYDIPYNEVANDELHPCVVFFFEKDAIEYIPAIGVNDVPRYEYVFEQRDCHPKIRVVNSHTVRSLQGNQYRAAICHKSVQSNLSKKKFSFKITKTTNNWLALGLCHSTTALHSHYTFDFQGQSHGYYMISSNGGSWSSIDPKKNNIVRAFKFGVGDVVECEVAMGNEGEERDRVVFRKGEEVYEVEVRMVEGDQLRPCVIMYYGGDEVEVLPEF